MSERDGYCPRCESFENKALAATEALNHRTREMEGYRRECIALRAALRESESALKTVKGRLAMVLHDKEYVV